MKKFDRFLLVVLFVLGVAFEALAEDLESVTFTVTSITSVAETNFNGSVVTVNYSAFGLGDYASATAKLTVNNHDYTYGGELSSSGGAIAFHVVEADASAGNIVKAVFSVVGSKSGVSDVTAYRNTVFLYQGHEAAVTTNGWFSTSATGTTLNEQGGSWGTVKPPAADGKIVFDEDDNGDYPDYAFTPSTAQAGQVAVINTTIAFDCAKDDVTNLDAQAAFCIVQAGDAYRFATITNGVWMTNETLAAALETEYQIRVSFDYRTIPGSVAYEVYTGSAYETIARGLLRTDAQALEQMSVSGTGKMASITAGDGVGSVDAALAQDADGSKYATIDDVPTSKRSGITLLWNTAWTPDAAVDGAWTIAAGGYNLYVNPTTGVLVTKDGTTYSVIANYYEAMNLLFGDSVTTNKFMFFTNAVVSGGATITNLYLLRDVTLGMPLAVNRDIWFNGESNVFEGATLAVDSGKTFTIVGGHIGITTNAAGVVLKGGRFANNTSWDAPTGYSFSQLAVVERSDYGWQLIETEKAPKTGEELLPVKTAEGESVSVVVNTSWAKEVTGQDTAAKQSEVFSVKQVNGLTRLDNEILGLAKSGAVSANDIPVIQPMQSTTTDKVTFKLGNVNQTTIANSGARVSYCVYSSTTPGGKDSKVSTSVEPTASVEVDLPTSGVRYYTIEVDTGSVK